MIILQYPHESLRTKTKGVEKVTPELVAIANDMYKVMRENGGIGLASNQVGLDISLIVLENNGSPLIMFNPVIIKKYPGEEYGAEGCLSFAGVTRIIKRHKEVAVRYRDHQGKMQYIVLKGLQARCVIHECEHLLGKNFLQYDEKT